MDDGNLWRQMEEAGRKEGAIQLPQSSVFPPLQELLEPYRAPPPTPPEVQRVLSLLPPWEAAPPLPQIVPQRSALPPVREPVTQPNNHSNPAPDQKK